MSERVALITIKRAGGLDLWPSLHQWHKRKVYIWSGEHEAFWRAGGIGYTLTTADAGQFDFLDAYRSTKLHGPEKHIAFVEMAEAAVSKAEAEAELRGDDAPPIGMTQAEKALLEKLSKCASDFVDLPVLHPNDYSEFGTAIHVLQNIVLARAAFREMWPNGFRK